jgi:hypothetical protein
VAKPAAPNQPEARDPRPKTRVVQRASPLSGSSYEGRIWPPEADSSRHHAGTCGQEDSETQASSSLLGTLLSGGQNREPEPAGAGRGAAMCQMPAHLVSAGFRPEMSFGAMVLKPARTQRQPPGTDQLLNWTAYGLWEEEKSHVLSALR